MPTKKELLNEQASTIAEMHEMISELVKKVDKLSEKLCTCPPKKKKEVKK